MKQPKCIDCRYWEGDRKNDRTQGVCHFEPPKVVGVMQQQGIAGQQPVPVSAMPLIHASSWCSRHELEVFSEPT